jgi:hypothetical protein
MSIDWVWVEEGEKAIRGLAGQSSHQSCQAGPGSRLYAYLGPSPSMAAASAAAQPERDEPPNESSPFPHSHPALYKASSSMVAAVAGAGERGVWGEGLRPGDGAILAGPPSRSILLPVGA